MPEKNVHPIESRCRFQAFQTMIGEFSAFRLGCCIRPIDIVRFESVYRTELLRKSGQEAE
jgi:hypothetical protein